MRLLFLSILLLSFAKLNAQNLVGVVRERTSKKTIAGAQIIDKQKVVITNNNGIFVLPNANKSGCHFSVRLMGYKTIEVTLVEVVKDTLAVFLNTNPVDLREVTIKLKKNAQKDSIALREQYKNVFEYKAPTIGDAFMKVDPSYRSPFAHESTMSTASLVSLDILQVAGLLSKKKNKTSKLKSVLLKKEEENFIASRFDEEQIQKLTKLEGDSLKLFMNTYQPDIKTARTLTPYEMSLYIKKSYQEFTKPSVAKKPN